MLETLAWTLPAILAVYTTARWASGHASALILHTTTRTHAALITAQIGAIATIAAIHDNQLFVFFKTDTKVRERGTSTADLNPCPG